MKPRLVNDVSTGSTMSDRLDNDLDEVTGNLLNGYSSSSIGDIATMVSDLPVGQKTAFISGLRQLESMCSRYGVDTLTFIGKVLAVGFISGGTAVIPIIVGKSIKVIADVVANQVILSEALSANITQEHLDELAATALQTGDFSDLEHAVFLLRHLVDYYSSFKRIAMLSIDDEFRRCATYEGAPTDKGYASYNWMTERELISHNEAFKIIESLHTDIDPATPLLMYAMDKTVEVMEARWDIDPANIDVSQAGSSLKVKAMKAKNKAQRGQQEVGINVERATKPVVKRALESSNIDPNGNSTVLASVNVPAPTATVSVSTQGVSAAMGVTSQAAELADSDLISPITLLVKFIGGKIQEIIQDNQVQDMETFVREHAGASALLFDLEAGRGQKLLELMPSISELNHGASEDQLALYLKIVETLKQAQSLDQYSLNAIRGAKRFQFYVHKALHELYKAYRDELPDRETLQHHRYLSHGENGFEWSRIDMTQRIKSIKEDAEDDFLGAVVEDEGLPLPGIDDDEYSEDAIDLLSVEASKYQGISDDCFAVVEDDEDLSLPSIDESAEDKEEISLPPVKTRRSDRSSHRRSMPSQDFLHKRGEEIMLATHRRAPHMTDNPFDHMTLAHEFNRGTSVSSEQSDFDLNNNSFFNSTPQSRPTHHRRRSSSRMFSMHQSQSSTTMPFNEYTFLEVLNEDSEIADEDSKQANDQNDFGV